MVKTLRCGFFSNCFLLSGDGGSILIDSGNVGNGNSLYERLKDENVRLIILTHGHFDHVGSAKFLSKCLGAPIAMSEADVRLIGRGELSVLRGHTVPGRVISLFSKDVLRRMRYSVFMPDVLLTDDQDLSEFGVAARVVALPGHTKGSLGVLTDSGEMVVGDAMAHLGMEVPIYEDRSEMEESAAKIRRSGARIVYFSHGLPLKMGAGSV